MQNRIGKTIEKEQRMTYTQTSLHALNFIKLQESSQCGISIRTDKSMKQNRKSRNRPIVIQSTDFFEKDAELN